MDSDDYTTDEGKRKRDDIDEAFRKSKKTVRSPKKGEESKHEMMETMMQLLNELTVNVKEIKDKQYSHSEDMRLLKSELKKLREEQKQYTEEITSLREMNEKAAEEIKGLRSELTVANDRLEKLERDKRKKNAVVYGINIDTDNQSKLKETMENFLDKELNVKMQLNAVRKLGNRICLMEFARESDKIRVMQNKSKLKGMKGQVVYINDDLTKQEREIQEKVRNMAKEERQRGKTVKEGFQKLVIDNETWMWDKEKANLEKVTSTSHRQKN